ncbi:MAG: hypothetical protein WAU53_16555 [Rhodoplanes sp.]
MGKSPLFCRVTANNADATSSPAPGPTPADIFEQRRGVRAALDRQAVRGRGGRRGRDHQAECGGGQNAENKFAHNHLLYQPPRR